MNKSIINRSKFIISIFAMVSVIIIVRALKVQVIQSEVWKDKADSQTLKQQRIVAPRGSILDRRGIPLAVSETKYEIAIAPGEVQNMDSLRFALLKATGISSTRIKALLGSRRSWIVLPGRYKVEQRIALGKYKGVHFSETMRRFYPQGGAAKPLLGGITVDGRGTGGVEAAYDSILSGEAGYRLVYKDARGRVRTPDNHMSTPSVKGADIVLTIDAKLQEIASQALEMGIDSTNADGGDVVIVDPNTGDILAAASIRRGTGLTLGMISEPYEPGSIVKPFIYAALLQENKIDMGDSVFAENGQAVFNGRRINDVHPYGWLSLSQALAVSSNVVLGKIAPKMTEDTQYAYMSNFGFGRTSGLSIPGEAKGLLRTPDKWSKMSQVSLAIGYEVSATPLQMALAYAALANGGKFYKARLIKEIRHPQASVRVILPQSTRQVVSAEVSQEIKKTLVEVIRTGTGRNADMGAFTVAGKTGTSRAFGGGGYQGYYASFAGFFPVERPQIAIAIRIIRPRSGVYYGGTVAAPIARNIFASLLSSDAPIIDRAQLAQDKIQPVTVQVRSQTDTGFSWSQMRTTGVIERRTSTKATGP